MIHSFIFSEGKLVGQDLELEFVTIHNPVRKVKGEGYFACTDFRVRGEPEKLYDIDFWLNQQGDKLAVTAVRIHKQPEKEGAFQARVVAP